MRTLRRVLAAPLALALAVSLATPVADACGGCFHPPTATAQVVTDHRMVLSLSTTRTTLWDQFQYAGRASEFSWILPIRYTERTQVQLASDDFVSLMSSLTVPTIVAPTPPPRPPGCQPPPFAGGGFDASAGGFLDAASAADSSVSVLREEVVGPYAVSILRGTDAMVLRRWLNDNNYLVPAGLEPTLQHYIDLNMDFVALRLRPGEGINRMVPVRVSVDGYQPRLPLRMIAAGIADKVGLSLLVFNEARVETSNFPNATFRDEDFVYDWNAPPADLARVVLNRFDALNRANGGRVWVTESAQRFTQSEIVSRAQSFGVRPPLGDDAGMMRVASAVDDATFAFEGIGATAMVTRLRADLEGRMLDRDLDLAASTAGERSRAYRFGTEQNRPMYSACPWPTTDAGTVALDGGAGSGSLDAGVSRAADAAAPAVTPSTAGGGVQCGARPGAGRARDALTVAVLALGAALRLRRRAR
ncbi:MAG: DUF2330 domain-containing protein [Polyangiales bacterium]